MGKKKIKTIFDVEVKAGEGKETVETVIVQPNANNKNALSVFLKKGESEPRKYYDISLLVQDSDCGLARLVIEGNQECRFIKLEGSKIRFSIPKVPEVIDSIVKEGLVVVLERGFSKLEIEATSGNIVFTAT